MSALSQAFVFQTGTVFTTGANSGVSLGGAVAIGDLLVVVYESQDNSRSISSITDSAGTTYAAARSPIEDGGAGRAQIWFGIASSTSAGQNVVATLSGNNAGLSTIGVGAFSGCASDQSGRTSNGSSSSGVTAHNSGTVTPPNGSGVEIGICNWNDTASPSDTGFTFPSSGDAKLVVGYRLNNGSVDELNLTSGGATVSVMQIVAFAGGATVTVSSVNGGVNPYAGQTAVTIVGTNFGASQGTGFVKIAPSDNIADAGAVSQTVTAWSDTSITITVVKGSLSLDTNLYLFVKNNAGASNSAGKVLQIGARPYVRETLIDKNGAAAASVTGIVMLVWRADPTTGAPNPNEALTVATNGSGQIDQVITRGALALSAPVWIALFKPGSPARGTARKVTPVYE